MPASVASEATSRIPRSSTPSPAETSPSQVETTKPRELPASVASELSRRLPELKPRKKFSRREGVSGGQGASCSGGASRDQESARPASGGPGNDCECVCLYAY